MSVQRYGLQDNHEGGSDIYPEDMGDYVKYTDYEKLESRLAAYEKAIIVMQDGLNNVMAGTIDGRHPSSKKELMYYATQILELAKSQAAQIKE